MKTDLLRPLVLFWRAMSEVPGWPDAPFGARVRRLWPLLVPVVGCAAIAAWVHGIREPMRARERMAHAAVSALELETEQLRQSFSEHVAAEVTARAVAAQAQLLASPAELEARLIAFVATARAAGWNANHQVYGISEDAAVQGDAALLTFAPARVRLEPRPENADRFSSLVRILSELAAMPGRTEITRVIVRSDASGVPLAEVNLRAACRPSDEKAAE